MDDFRDPPSGTVSVLMPPDTPREPSSGRKLCVRVRVPRSIARELLQPKIPIRLGDGRVLGARMPEASVDKHCNTAWAEDNVRLAPPIERQRPMKPKP